MEKWKGRVALVTGASSGIGAAICSILVQNGMKVVGTARRMDKIKELADYLKNDNGSLLPVKCDLSQDEDIYFLFKSITDEFGGVDICINNAGMACDHGLLDGTPDEWRQMMNVNVISLCLCNKLAVASLRERGVDDGHIININSTSGHHVSALNFDHFYSGTKHAVTAITEGLRMELREAKSRIRVSSVSPGMVDTEFFKAMYKDENKAKVFMSSFPCLSPEDVASTVLHVISAPPHVEINDIIIRPTEETI